MTKTITESGMNFIADNVFHIEKSPQYTRLGNGVKSVEFVRARGNKLIFVEAKSSFPKRDNIDNEKSARFHAEIEEIFDKFVHSLNLYSSIEVGVADIGFSDDFKPADRVSLVLLLVINGFESDWCIPIKKALQEKLHKSQYIATIWKPIIAVINDRTAAKQKLTIIE
ncbi:MAG: hypothetical protein LBL39_06885 [Planctomycetaceae bacterium]|jgi:hypothetical protein|nr:hypothetical protein [Planctomycetaceae bacterium]